MRQFLLVLALTFGLMPLTGQTTEPLLFFPVSPYLQNMSPTAVTVMYQSGGSVHSWVEVGRDSLHTTAYRQLAGGQEVVHDDEHKVRIERLEPGATYYYRVCATEILTNQAYKKEFGRTVKTPFYKMTLPADTTRNFTAVVL
ncbi:MAG: fibronectin type III domain-containing protein, partial [Alloprevotella sp.]|nr:fibronectin type III domain-containing protein [Alloprevotella sp.]